MNNNYEPHTLMVQGTTSDAGKSILCTALCRILARHGHNVAPFKSQNMALNSAVTPCGGEIGRAQAVQAEAAFLAPHVHMNPVLLKPNSDIGAQVIVNGKAQGNMNAAVYHEHKPHLLGQVIEAYKALQAEHPVIIVEGAGSPAEINLRERDIANMGLAEAINCRVIIVADIDRGGVFAHLVGTYELLSENERARIAGFVINRFRGDVELLKPGITWLEERLSIPVLAVIPYIPDLQIEAEDAIDQSQTGIDAKLSVKVIVYPRISNHTDFDVLRHHPDVDCTFIRSAKDAEGADLLILPGSKSVRDDLEWLSENGFVDAIARHCRFGGKLLGICGGYQMLGRLIHDPQGVESRAGSSEGLGYLPMDTTLTGSKTLENVTGTYIGTKARVAGYEIHAGVSKTFAPVTPLFQVTSSANLQHDEGAKDDTDTVRGSYLHGLFDEPETLEAFLQWAGLKSVTAFDYPEFRSGEFDRLANVVEKAWPYDRIAKLLELNA